MILLHIHCSWFFVPFFQLWLVFSCDHHSAWCMLRWFFPSQLYIRVSRNILFGPTFIHGHFLFLLIRLIFWCLTFSIKRAFIAIGVLIFSLFILLVFASCLMVLVSWVITYFSEFMVMDRFSDASEISSFIVMVVLAPWKLAWVALMCCSLWGLWYSLAENLLKSAHVLSDEIFLRHIFIGYLYRSVANTVVYALFIV